MLPRVRPGFVLALAFLCLAVSAQAKVVSSNESKYHASAGQ
jgi:hypothetical protein